MSSKRPNGKADQIKRRIIKLFNENVKGRIPDTSDSNIKHDGKGGHWLEKQMGLKHNANNAPDLEGFEMKNNTTSKTTFGDWSPRRSLRIYGRGNIYNLDRSAFLKVFGAPNTFRNNRYSWSGKPVPNVSGYNLFGQKLKVDKEGNIFAIYSYSKDKRPDKSAIVPKLLQKENLVLAMWDAEMMRKRVENKFNKLGWFKCEKDKSGVYYKIVFGAAIDFENWIEGVRKGVIFFDSGMYDGNKRPYANWRANNKYWDSLVVDSY